MNQRTSLLLFLLIFISCTQKTATLKIFDVHLHGGKAPAQQLKDLENAGVYKTAVSTSWNLQQQYSKGKEMSVLHGLMFPCPNGKVPYSQQPCFVDGKDWPSLSWVEEQIQQKKINFLGEVLSQYFGISSSDSLLFPYYALAEKYNLPLGIHTGSAGPDHGSPFFKEEMGNPVLLKKNLTAIPKAESVDHACRCTLFKRSHPADERPPPSIHGYFSHQQSPDYAPGHFFDNHAGPGQCRT